MVLVLCMSNQKSFVLCFVSKHDLLFVVFLEKNGSVVALWNIVLALGLDLWNLYSSIVSVQSRKFCRMGPH